MNNSPGKRGLDVDIRSLLKHQHKRVYSVCRLFANNYKEHQDLFINIIAAASQNIRARRENSDKQMLIMRACINMAALHSITLEVKPAIERPLQFKSPDYQRSMTNFREALGETSDYEKFRLFLEFEKIPPEELTPLTGLSLPKGVAGKKKEKGTGSTPTRKVGFHFIPYLKEKLVWN